jgi:predicted transcriptional regulator of viral defense system
MKAWGDEMFARELDTFLQYSGGLRMSEALKLGINRKTLYAMRDAGLLEQFSRGAYRLASLEPLQHPQFVTIATRVKYSVICLHSALWFHGLSTLAPHVVDVAIERGTRRPRLDHPPTRTYWFSGPAYHEGIEVVIVDDVPVSVYNPEKTLADCFRYRKQLGMDLVLEGLRLWRNRRVDNVDLLMSYARMRNVERSLRPYLDARS